MNRLRDELRDEIRDPDARAFAAMGIATIVLAWPVMWLAVRLWEVFQW